MIQQNAHDLSFAPRSRQPSNKRYFWRHDLNTAVLPPLFRSVLDRSVQSRVIYPFAGVLTFSVIPRSVEPGLEEEEASRSITCMPREPEFHEGFSDPEKPTRLPSAPANIQLLLKILILRYAMKLHGRRANSPARGTCLPVLVKIRGIAARKIISDIARGFSLVQS